MLEAEPHYSQAESVTQLSMNTALSVSYPSLRLFKELLYSEVP